MCKLVSIPRMFHTTTYRHFFLRILLFKHTTHPHNKKFPTFGIFVYSVFNICSIFDLLISELNNLKLVFGTSFKIINPVYLKLRKFLCSEKNSFKCRSNSNFLPFSQIC